MRQEGLESIWNRNYILLLASNFLICITYYSIISALPIYLVNELHANKSEVGIVLAAYTLASVLIRPFSGFSLDKYGRRAIFLISLFFYSLLFSGYLLALSIFTLIVLRFMQGLSWGVATISASTVVVDITPAQKRGEGIGYFALSTTLAMSIGPVLGLFINHHFGPQAMFMSILFTSLISFACAAAIRFPRRLLVRRRLVFSTENMFSKKAVLPSLNLLVIMTTYGGLLSFIALYGQEMGIKNTSFFFLVFSIGIASARFLAGKSFDKKGPHQLLTFCLSILIVGFIMLVVFKNQMGYYIAALTMGFGIGVVFPTFQAIINNLADNSNRGAANSTLYTALDIGMGAGMILSGYIAQYFSIAAVFICCVFAVLAGLLFFRYKVSAYYENNRVKIQ